MAEKKQPSLALKALYKAYFSELTGYIRAQFGNGPPDPDDIAQAAFLRFSSVESGQIIRNPRAFLYATARNLVIDHKRRQKTHSTYADEIFSRDKKKFDEISPERVLIDRERFAIMRTVIKALPETERRVVLMHRLQSRTYADIARELDMSESGVRRAVARAIEAIDQALKSKGA